MAARISRPLGAVLLGALTFLVTPIVSWVGVHVVLAVTGSNGLDPAETIARRDLGDMSAFFFSAVLVAAVLWLLGGIVTGLVSWSVYRSKSLAALTLASALALQAGGAAWSVASRVMQPDSPGGASVDSAFAAARARITSNASLGRPEVTVRDARALENAHPEFGSSFQFLDVVVPVSVRRAGTYHFYIRFDGHQPDPSTHLSRLVVLQLEPGRDTLHATFGPGAFWAPERTGGRCEIKSYYVLTEQQLERAAAPLMGVSKAQLREAERFLDEDSRSQNLREEFVAATQIEF